LEKINEIDELKRKLLDSRDVINRQKRTIQKLTPKKTIVADWLKPPTVSPKPTVETKADEWHGEYITIGART